MLVVVAVAAVLAMTVAYILSVPLEKALARMERGPLVMVSAELFDIASESFHELLDYRKEDDLAEVAAAQEEVLARIGKYRPPVKGADYHFAVVGGDNAVLADPDGVLDASSLPGIARLPGEGETAIVDREGRELLVHHRYFPAWRWRLLTIIRRDDMRREADRIKLWVFGSGAAGFMVLIAIFYVQLRSRVQEPLRRLVARANGMVEGNYGAGGGIAGGEVGELSEAFDRMSAAIRQREAELREIAKLPESSPGIVMKVTPDGRIVYANRSAGRMLAGMDLPMQHAEFLLPDDAAGLVRAVSSSQTRKMEVTWKVRGRTIEYTIFGFEDEDAAVFHGADVTERKQMEEQLLHSQKMETLGMIAGEPGRPEPPGGDGRAPGRTGTALLVDDEECVRDVGKAMLSSLGYDVLTAGNGLEAVEIYRAERDRISLTILDLQMPVMDGRKAFEGIRAIDPRATVVVSTGFSGGEDVDRLKDLGVAAILPKPYSLGDITRVVTLLEAR